MAAKIFSTLIKTIDTVDVILKNSPSVPKRVVLVPVRMVLLHMEAGINSTQKRATKHWNVMMILSETHGKAPINKNIADVMPVKH